jgi:hypothetical protein
MLVAVMRAFWMDAPLGSVTDPLSFALVLDWATAGGTHRRRQQMDMAATIEIEVALWALWASRLDSKCEIRFMRASRDFLLQKVTKVFEIQVKQKQN